MAFCQEKGTKIGLNLWSPETMTWSINLAKTVLLSSCPEITKTKAIEKQPRYSQVKNISKACGFLLLLISHYASLRPVSHAREACKQLKKKNLNHHFKFCRFSTTLWKTLWKTLPREPENKTNGRICNTFRKVTQRIAWEERKQLFVLFCDISVFVKFSLKDEIGRTNIWVQ